MLTTMAQRKEIQAQGVEQWVHCFTCCVNSLCKLGWNVRYDVDILTECVGEGGAICHDATGWCVTGGYAPTRQARPRRMDRLIQLKRTALSAFVLSR